MNTKTGADQARDSHMAETMLPPSEQEIRLRCLEAAARFGKETLQTDVNAIRWAQTFRRWVMQEGDDQS